MSRWQESKRGTDRWQGMSKRRANSTDESASSPPPGVGAFGTSVPESILLPTRTSSHPSGTSVDVSRQQRSTVARRGNVDGTRRWMAAAEAAGNLTRKPRTKPASFSVPGFFPEPKACRVPCFPPFVLVGRGVLNGVVDFFSFFITRPSLPEFPWRPRRP